MAILVEEEKKPVNWVGIATAIIIIGILFFGAYYVFFKDPGVIEGLTAPKDLQNITQLSKTNIDPSKIIQSTEFKNLKDLADPLVLPSAGRANPFKPL
jgi:hypothetical protein